jgi:hypothetical protein
MLNRTAALLGIMAFAAPAMAAPYQPHFTILYTLSGGTDGAPPNGPLVSDDSGNLFGTTENGGQSCSASNNGCGPIFLALPNWAIYSTAQFTGTPDASVRDGSDHCAWKDVRRIPLWRNQ